MGSLSSAETVDHALNRIGEIDAGVDGINSVIEVNPDAMAIAMERDADRRDGTIRSPLHGTPILLKDNIDTNDAMQTTAGSLALLGSPPTTDAAIVTRLREAGLVILGKTNLSEWANFRSPHSTSGWSGRGGLTRNPWDSSRSAGGSSSGSGAAVAAGLAMLAIGTETDGSIVCPASFNGVVGLKPTVGLLAQTGIVPISHSQDAPGPIARSTSEVAALLDVLCNSTTYTSSVADPRGVSDRRIGVLRQFFGEHSPTDIVVDAAIGHLSRAGATIVDDVAYPDDAVPLGDDELLVLLHEFKHDLTAYLATRPDPSPRSLADVIAFNEANRDVEMPWFGHEYFEQADATDGLGDPLYVEARDRGRQTSRGWIDTVLNEHRLDALVAPAFPPAPVIDLVIGDSDLGGDITSAPAVAGYPVLSVPVGFVHGLPVGLAVTGTADSEPTLLRVAATLEQSLGLFADRALIPPV